MPDRKTSALLALSCVTLCPACNTDTYRPAPIPPAIETDVDLLGLTARISGALDRCADQVDAIRAVYDKGVH